LNVKPLTKKTAILILTNVGATTESCRVASPNPVNICGLSGIFGM